MLLTYTPERRFYGLRLVRPERLGYTRGYIEYLSTKLDLSCIRKYMKYDKRGARILLNDFRTYWFNGESLTKRRVEAFFDDPENFEQF